MVIYLSDDHSQADSSLYGASDIPTPHFERMASDGMVFTHAFVASPACAASRGAMLTRLMPARNGAEANHTQPRPEVKSLVGNLKAAGYEVVAFGKVAHGNGKRYGFDRMWSGRSCEALRKDVGRFLAERRSDKPLCLFAGTGNPHVPWPDESSFDPQDVVIPSIHLDMPATRHYRTTNYEEIRQFDALLGDLRKLAAEHLGENTLFIHSADHGSQWPFGKWTLYVYGTRVPFLAAWPGVIKPGTKSAAMIQWPDLLPTLIEFAGGNVPAGLDGRSFADVLRGKKTEHRERIFTTHSGDGNKNIYPIRAVRTREWKLIRNLHPENAFTTHIDLVRANHSCAYWTDWAKAAKKDGLAKQVVDRYYRRPKWELYRVADDKWEQRNLADKPEQAKVMESLKKELAEWRRKQGDSGENFNEPRPPDRPETWHPDEVKLEVKKPKRKGKKGGQPNW